MLQVPQNKGHLREINVTMRTPSPTSFQKTHFFPQFSAYKPKSVLLMELPFFLLQGEMEKARV